MRKRTKLLPLILAFSMLLSLAAPAAAAEAEKSSAIVRFEDGTDVDALCAELEKLPGISVRWKYEALFKGAAIEGSAAALKRVEDCGFAQSVALSRTWAQPAAVGDPAGTSNSLDVLRAEDIAYDGKGTVIAVIDSGVYLSHETFANYGLVTETITRDCVDEFVENGGTDGRYVSEKIPFAYDYHGSDRSVHTMDPHGTHVSALAVGYAPNEDGSVKFRGVAPAAQLLAMKVFPDKASVGAKDTDILRAMEDAYLLGADVVNLSLGTEGDFMEGSEIGKTYQEVISKLRKAGIIVCCATGNAATAVTGKTEGTALPTADYTDYGTPCVPAAYPGATAIAAVNAATREGGGGIMVGEKVLSYQKAVSEDNVEVLPDLDDLSGKTMDYVVIGGLGAKEDFAGLDLTGCVALVQRGELLFSEKTNNAAAAGAVACLIYNNEAGTLLPAVSNTSIPCAVITREDGAYMIEQAESGRGTLTIEPNRVMISTGEILTMMAYSSWGATSDLRLVPALTAPGGEILSAVPGSRDKYGYMSGTSMATPNASGSFAAVLQALRERGVKNKTERSELAEDLLVSTAAILRGEDGTYLSPRQQGAGVIDLSAALRSTAVIRQPILELGESSSGIFYLTFTVQNLSEEARTFSVDVSVLTDAFVTDGMTVYSKLAPIDITDYVLVSGADAVTVGAKSERSVRLTLQIDRDIKKSLEEIYTNGFFTEGFVTLTDEAGQPIHATFMGYCGDWEAAPVIEQADFRDLMDRLAAGEDGAAPAINMWYNNAFLATQNGGIDQQVMLGENPWLAAKALDERIVMSTPDSDAMLGGGWIFAAELYTLRNAAHVIMIVSDRRTGAIYKVMDEQNVVRSDIGATIGQAMNSVHMAWDGTDGEGRALESGTGVNVAFYAWTESDRAMQDAYRRSECDPGREESYRWLTSAYYRNCLEWEFPLMLDGERPVISAAVVKGDGTATLTVTDNEFLAYAAVQDGEGRELAREAFAAEQRGEEHTLAISGGVPETVYVTLVDYAGNTMGYELTLTEEGDGEAALCRSALFSDVRKNAWYHEAVDFVCEKGLMEATDTLLFEPDRSAMRSTVIDALYRLAGEPKVDGVEVPFVDVKDHEWYYDALVWAYKNGIAGGYSEKTFAPLAPIPRQQLATMLYRAAKLNGEVTAHSTELLGGFADAADVSDWAAEAMAWAVGEGIFAGDGEGRLNPRVTTTRAELAQILMNILEDN